MEFLLVYLVSVHALATLEENLKTLLPLYGGKSFKYSFLGTLKFYSFLVTGSQCDADCYIKVCRDIPVFSNYIFVPLQLFVIYAG